MDREERFVRSWIGSGVSIDGKGELLLDLAELTGFTYKKKNHHVEC